MDLYRLLLLLFYVIVSVFIDETEGHPKSWLTTTKRPKPRPKKPKRSVSNVDVIYYPGLTAEYKDALRFEELRKFLHEEEEDAEGEDEVVIRLLQEEQESTTDEPIEFAVQKRLMLQLKNVQSPLHEVLDVIEFPGESLEFEARLEIPQDRQNGNDFLHFESFQYTLEDAKQRYEKIYNPISDHPSIDNIPESIIKRFLLDEPATSSRDNNGDTDLQKHTNTPCNHPLHHDINVDLRHAQNDDHDTRHKFLLINLLDHQEQIEDEDLAFFLMENEEDGVVQTNQPHEVESSTDAISEAQLDWEEYHEYDA